MDADHIRAEGRAVIEIGRGLDAFGKGIGAAIASAERDLEACRREFDDAQRAADRSVRAGEQAVYEAQSALDRCEDDPAPYEEELRRQQAALTAASRQYEQIMLAYDRFQTAAIELGSTMRTAQAAILPPIAATRPQLLEHVARLQSYLTTEVGR